MTSSDNDAGRSESSDSTAGGSEPSTSGQEAPPIEQASNGSTDQTQTFDTPTPPTGYTPPPAYNPSSSDYGPAAYAPTTGYPPPTDYSAPPYPPPATGFPPAYPDPAVPPPFPPPGYGVGYPPPGPPGPYGAAPGGYPPPPGGYPSADYAYGYAGYPGPPPTRTNSMATASLVSSLIAVPAYLMCFIGFIPSLLGIVLGAVALSQVKGSGEKGKELAIGGIAVGAIGILAGIALIAFISAAGPTTF